MNLSRLISSAGKVAEALVPNTGPEYPSYSVDSPSHTVKENISRR